MLSNFRWSDKYLFLIQSYFPIQNPSCPKNSPASTLILFVRPNTARNYAFYQQFTVGNGDFD